MSNVQRPVPGMKSTFFPNKKPVPETSGFFQKTAWWRSQTQTALHKLHHRSTTYRGRIMGNGSFLAAFLFLYNEEIPARVSMCMHKYEGAAIQSWSQQDSRKMYANLEYTYLPRVAS